MASLMGTIQFIQPLRRVKFVKTGLEGWFHGFYQQDSDVVALIELPTGRVVMEYPSEIQFTRSPDSEAESESELVKEARQWKAYGRIQEIWMSVTENERDALTRCYRCGEYAHRNKDGICLICWKKLTEALTQNVE